MIWSRTERPFPFGTGVLLFVPKVGGVDIAR